jgi:DNA-binding response OmpR family regulator
MESQAKRVVCIEDEPEMIDLVRLILGRKGFEVIGANGGVEGLETVRREKPDLVLLDLMMPDMDGWEVYQQIKADKELRDIPVVVVTAKAQSIDKVLGLHIAKVDDYITKPFGPQELLESVTKNSGQHDWSAVGASRWFPAASVAPFSCEAVSGRLGRYPKCDSRAIDRRPRPLVRQLRL